MNIPHSKRKQGFTLVEMMVALAVGTVIMVLVLYSFSSLSASMKATEYYRDMHRDVRHAMDIMRRDITGGTGVSQCTASSRLTFTTTAASAGTGSVTVVYNLADNNELSRTVSGSNTNQTLLAAGVEKVKFTLYDAAGTVTTVPANAYFVEVEVDVKTQGVRNTYEDTLQTRARMRMKDV